MPSQKGTFSAVNGLSKGHFSAVNGLSKGHFSTVNGPSKGHFSAVKGRIGALLTRRMDNKKDKIELNHVSV